MHPAVERTLLEMPQVECPVAHHFGPGIYIREVTLPAGAFVVGHAQKERHLNVMIAGKVAVFNGGDPKILEAPLVYVGEPGRKMGYVIETVVWQNIYSTKETDIDKLESIYLDKSSASVEYEKEKHQVRRHLYDLDRKDFAGALFELGVDSKTVREQSESVVDLVGMPTAFAGVTTVRNSNIEGKGLFLNWTVEKGTVIAPALIAGKRTNAGRYVNHSANPNCKYSVIDSNIYLVSVRPISGCTGGGPGDELTVDYRKTRFLAEELACQA